MHHSLQIPNQMLIHFLWNGLEISWIFFRSYQCTRVRFPLYGNLSSNCLWRNTLLKFTKFVLIILKIWLACLAWIYGVMDALEKFGEHERSVRVALFLMNHFSTSPIFFLTHKYIFDIKITYSFLVWLYVRVLLNTNGAEVTPMKFNARGTTNPDWFSQNNLTQSPWTDLKSATILKPFCINTGHATLNFCWLCRMP